MKILVSYRGIPQSPGWATGDMVVKAFRALGHEAYPYAKYYQENRWVEGRPALDSQDWDLILFMECNDGDQQYPELRITRARKTACWLFDTSYQFDRWRRLARYFSFDHYFLANPVTIGEYKVWGYDNVHYLPYACDRELHGRPLEHPKTHDLVLVGSIRDDRRDLARELTGHGLKLELISDVFREDYIDALASGKIVINQNPDMGRGLLNMRFFEAQAAGTIVFTEMADLEVNMTAGLMHMCNFVPYRTVEDIVTGHASAQGSNIQRGQELVFEHHTYQNRCEDILNTVFPYERD